MDTQYSDHQQQAGHFATELSSPPHPNDDAAFSLEVLREPGGELRLWKNLSTESPDVVKVTTNLSDSPIVTDLLPLPDGCLLIIKEGDVIVLTPSPSGWTEIEVPTHTSKWGYKFSLRENGVVMTHPEDEAIRLG